MEAILDSNNNNNNNNDDDNNDNDDDDHKLNSYTGVEVVQVRHMLHQYLGKIVRDCTMNGI